MFVSPLDLNLQRSSKTQTPSSREAPMTKSQNSNFKHEKIPAFQMVTCFGREFENWNLGFSWSLEFGFWSFHGAWCLDLGAFPHPPPIFSPNSCSETWPRRNSPAILPSYITRMR